MLSFNLYSNALKYNVNVRESRYKLAVYSALAIFIFLVMLVSFTFYYIQAQALAVVSIIALSLFLSMSKKNRLTSSFILTNTGSIRFNNEDASYQLLAGSRLSFIGCWLVMSQNVPAVFLPKDLFETMPKQLFIFRDSINEQDYSRIARVIKQLE